MSTKEFVSPVTWANSPEWAKELAINPHGVSAWLGDAGYVYMTDIGRFHEWAGPSNFPRDCFKVVESRPVVWGGEGLPPVGMVCEIELIDKEWAQVVVVAITDYRIYCEQVGHHECVDGPNDWCPVKAHAKFRPIRTPEQIAAEERYAFIREALCCVERNAEAFNESLNDKKRSAIESTIAALYAAGYRKFEIVEGE